MAENQARPRLPAKTAADAGEAPKKRKANGKKKSAPKKKKRSRCAVCRARLSAVLLAAAHTCKCGNTYCGAHMHDHPCSFDFHREAASLLTKQNPVVAPTSLPEKL